MSEEFLVTESALLPKPVMTLIPEEITVTQAIQISRYSRLHIYDLIHRKKIYARRGSIIGAGRIFLINRESFLAYLIRMDRIVDGENT